MYICLCNGLTDRHIEQAIAAGACRPKDVYAACACRAQCKNCCQTILSLIRETLVPPGETTSATQTA